MATWFYYTFSAIILEDRGALDGLSASKPFGRTRKWKTFLMFSGRIHTSVRRRMVHSPFPKDDTNLGSEQSLDNHINIVLGLVAGVLSVVMASYTYIRYAMPKSLATKSVADSASSGEPPAVPGFAGRTLDFHVG